jgi:serine phosphatase RsbU (regulator of sigma subunit)
MTYRTTRNIVETGTTAAAALAFLVVPLVAAAGFPFLPAVAVAGAIFLVLYALRNATSAALERRAYGLSFRGRETRLVMEFSERVGVCFTILDLVDAIRDRLEKAADMGVILVKSATWEIVYQSPAAASSDSRMFEALAANFRDAPEGVSYINENLFPMPLNARARGFAIRVGEYHLLVLTRLCSRVEPEAFQTLYGELGNYFERVTTISELFEVASLSKEWQLIAETQRSFLPRQLPVPPKLELSVFYRPLVNVSGDYYDAIPVDENRTLLVVGDVSGKGLAAALIMGIIVNTIRVAKDKTDLPALIRSVDAAVRDMGFDDKYTVMFLGLVDTAKRTLRYVNAAMADPIVITQTATGPKVLRLEPTMGLVGLVPFDEIVVEELPLRTDEIILLASDGVTEVSDASGARLGETELFERSLATMSKLGASDFVSSVSAMLYSYVGDRPLKDDVTILTAKVGRLWD